MLYVYPMRDVPRTVVPCVVVGAAAALVGYWIVNHWHFHGKVAVGVGFLMVFVWIGVLAYWFGRPRAQ